MMRKTKLAVLISALLWGAAASAMTAAPVAADQQIAREAAEGPRGGDNERAGDRQRRGGKGYIDAGKLELAREAAEGPRGGDNERAGDRQRRGGKGLA